jgi:hypothetical protein
MVVRHLAETLILTGKVAGVSAALLATLHLGPGVSVVLHIGVAALVGRVMALTVQMLATTAVAVQVMGMALVQQGPGVRAL